MPISYKFKNKTGSLGWVKKTTLILKRIVLNIEKLKLIDLKF